MIVAIVVIYGCGVKSSNGGGSGGGIGGYNGYGGCSVNGNGDGSGNGSGSSNGGGSNSGGGGRGDVIPTGAGREKRKRASLCTCWVSVFSSD